MSKTTKKIARVKPRVRLMLERDKKLGNEERNLLVQFWTEELKTYHNTSPNLITLQRFFDLYLDDNVTSEAGAISRAKRDILKKNPELRDPNYKRRQKESDDTKRDIKKL